MQRREFIGCAALGSVCAMARAGVAEAEPDDKPKKAIKITVLKKTTHNDLRKEIWGNEANSCPHLEEGQEFIFKSPWDLPEGFCGWAWADIRQYILAAWSSREYKALTCCTDGSRPVLFKVERVA